MNWTLIVMLFGAQPSICGAKNTPTVAIASVSCFTSMAACQAAANAMNDMAASQSAHAPARCFETLTVCGVDAGGEVKVEWGR